MPVEMQRSPSMNGKAYKGLSLSGLAAHIASSILLKNKGVGTINDCKHAIAHNVRAFQRRLIVEGEIRDMWETSAASKADRKQLDLEHAIPVGCLMNLLFWAIKTTDQATATDQVDALIRENSVLVWVTKDEHAKLNKKYQCKMPDGFDFYPWTDVLARYAQTLGVSKLKEFSGAPDDERPSESDLNAEIEDDFEGPSEA